MEEQEEKQNWIAYHNMEIIGFYETQDDANNALMSYKMGKQVDINDYFGVNQII